MTSPTVLTRGPSSKVRQMMPSEKKSLLLHYEPKNTLKTSSSFEVLYKDFERNSLEKTNKRLFEFPSKSKPSPRSTSGRPSLVEFLGDYQEKVGTICEDFASVKTFEEVQPLKIKPKNIKKEDDVPDDLIDAEEELWNMYESLYLPANTDMTPEEIMTSAIPCLVRFHQMKNENILKQINNNNGKLPEPIEDPFKNSKDHPFYKFIRNENDVKYDLFYEGDVLQKWKDYMQIRKLEAFAYFKNRRLYRDHCKEEFENIYLDLIKEIEKCEEVFTSLRTKSNSSKTLKPKVTDQQFHDLFLEIEECERSFDEEEVKCNSSQELDMDTFTKSKKQVFLDLFGEIENCKKLFEPSKQDVGSTKSLRLAKKVEKSETLPNPGKFFSKDVLIELESTMKPLMISRGVRTNTLESACSSFFRNTKLQDFQSEAKLREQLADMHKEESIDSLEWGIPIPKKSRNDMSSFYDYQNSDIFKFEDFYDPRHLSKSSKVRSKSFDGIILPKIRNKALPKSLLELGDLFETKYQENKDLQNFKKIDQNKNARLAKDTEKLHFEAVSTAVESLRTRNDSKAEDKLKTNDKKKKKVDCKSRLQRLRDKLRNKKNRMKTKIKGLFKRDSHKKNN